MRLQLQPAYLLHRRPYRDNSELLDVLTAEHGRVGVVARGLARRRAGGPLVSVLQPFRPLLLSLSGRGELLSLTAAEPGGGLAPLVGDALLAGFYVNELLLRVLQRFDAQPRVFVAYGRVLENLGEGGNVAVLALALRRFEFELIAELGYGVDLAQAVDTGRPVTASGCYRLHPGEGIVAADGVAEGADDVLSGLDLLAIAAGRLEAVDGRVLRRLAQRLLADHLGPEPLRSQRVFRRSPTAVPVSR